MNGFRETASHTNGRTNKRDSLGLKNGQNTDLNNRYGQYWGPLKSQKRAKNEHTHGKN